MPDWGIWLIAAGVLAAGEVVTLSFFLGPIAVAALVSAGVAALGASPEVQFAVFIVGSIASLAIFRPMARRHQDTPVPPTNTAALVGARAVVVERVDRDGGQVKIGGEVWSARPDDEGAEIEPGERVHVLKIDGATALVAHPGSADPTT